MGRDLTGMGTQERAEYIRQLEAAADHDEERIADLERRLAEARSAHLSWKKVAHDNEARVNDLVQRLAEAEAAFAAQPGASVSSYWKKRVEGAEARAERAERERDEWKARAEKWRSDSIEGHRQRDEALAKIERLNIAHGDDLARAEQAASEARAEAARLREAWRRTNDGEDVPLDELLPWAEDLASAYDRLCRIEDTESRLDRALALLREPISFIERGGGETIRVPEDWSARIAALLAETEGA